MILDQARSFGLDAVETALPDVATARRRMPALLDRLDALLAARRAALLELGATAAELDRTDDALRLGLARMALRHGHCGGDVHAYHNEDHALDILDGRLQRLADALGWTGLPAADWQALALFAVCHDLRQREAATATAPIGMNEATSVAEAQRILDACGFERGRDRAQYLALELMIAGSTFDARPMPADAAFNSADAVTSGGALAPRLPRLLDDAVPGWRDDPDAARALRLALLAADLDTANVAEPIERLAASALHLCREREWLAGRRTADADSALPCLRFLSDGQDRYFFELHRFASPVGAAVFGEGKARNAPRVRALSQRLRDAWATEPALHASGDAVLARFAALAAALA